MNNIGTTNRLLLIIVVPIVFYLLKILSFIFVPLVLAMFITLLFLPIMRWLNKRNVNKLLSIFIVIFIISGILILAGGLIKISSNEIIANKDVFIAKSEPKLLALVESIERILGVERIKGKNVIVYYFQKSNIMQNFGSTFDFITKTITMTLMTVFFVILLLSESINFQKILNNTIIKEKYSSVKAFLRIENDIIKFVKVKFIISFFTGVGFSLACVFFDVSFPIFWGLLAFALNFIQMIGSVIAVILLALFAFVELDPTGTLLFFIIVIIAVQVLMGSILEPIFMGKSFSINVITILIMLMLWGFLWGIPGLILSVPITVFLKIILEQFPKTQIIAKLIAGPEKKIKILRRKRKRNLFK